MKSASTKKSKNLRRNLSVEQRKNMSEEEIEDHNKKSTKKVLFRKGRTKTKSLMKKYEAS